MNYNQEYLDIRLVIVGDGTSGKTCILQSYVNQKFPDEYIPRVFENHTSLIHIDEEIVNLSLWDTAGQESYDRIRTLCYGRADIFLIAFSVVEISSFENAFKKWYPELSKDGYKNIPKVFIGNKIDLRDEFDCKHISKEAASQIFDQLGCLYLECSALSQEGLNEVFHKSIKYFIEHQRLQKVLQKVKEKVELNKSHCIIF